MRIHVGIDERLSDLFFNLDHAHAKKRDTHGNFVEFDADSINTTAVWFLRCMRDLGVRNVPSTQELVNDFYARV